MPMPCRNLQPSPSSSRPGEPHVLGGRSAITTLLMLPYYF